ncbi:alpha-(1,3)-fucosyltransferase C-like [Eurosta solidaginis]|uniref:alpha-(1,3)-fucosyltransferase C-like n=1 Tax=Eurosta solidaginis TaxID=178769 RepID=UPI003530D1A1
MSIMSDADSEWEYSDHLKNPILQKSALIMEIPKAVARKRRSKNKFKKTRGLKKCICLSLLALVLVTITVMISLTILAYLDVINSHHIGNKQKQNSILVLNWHTDVHNPLSLTHTQCKIVFANHSVTKLWTDEYYSYDAIIMNSTAENILHGIDAVNRYKENQLIIFATQKPLKYSNLSSDGLYMESFTKSFSYSLKSHFLWHPYKIVELKDFKIVAPSLQPQWSASAQSFIDDHERDFFLAEVMEPSPLALTVLQKPCHKARQDLIKLIMQNMDVHTYGECGNLTCPNNCLYLSNWHDNERYKFYLAFEEELCVDYVGNNFFKALSAHLLPVVFGGANYTYFAPPNSYINASDFTSIRELTDYLFYLDQNPEEHIKYFTWRHKYKIQSFATNFEEICDYVKRHSYNTQRNEQIINWLKENKCQPYELPSTWGS